MRKLIGLWTIGLCMALSSCGTLTGNNMLFKVKRGMTERQVKEILGSPDFRRFHGDMEQWEYQKISWIGYGKIILVDFEDGRVVNFDSFPEPHIDKPTVNVKVDNN